jgi:hypothetical protein
MRDNAPRRDYLTLADLHTETLSIECEPCGRRGRYNVARLIEKYGDMKLPDIRHVLANCPKAQSQSSHDRVGSDTAGTAGFHGEGRPPQTATAGESV